MSSSFGSGVGNRAQGKDNDAVKIMVVDDSAVIRGLIKRMIDPEPDLNVIASAGNGQAAIDRLRRDPVDVIILDIEMPVMDGLTALPKLIEVKPDVKIIMASTLTVENAEISMQALEAGAVDYVPKPTSTSEIGGAGDFQRQLLEKTRAVGRGGAGRRAAPTAGAAPSALAKKEPVPIYKAPVVLRDVTATARPEIIAIGSSTGGPQALFKVIGGLKPDMRIPIIITQHMPPTFTTILAQHMAKATNWPCKEAEEGEPLSPGRVYLAPGDYHMVIEQQGIRKVLRLNQNPPENFCRPAVDPMLRSVSAVYGNKALVAILTGMGADGRRGCESIVQAGGTVIAQDEKTSVVWGMPGAAATAGVCSAVLPLNDIAPYIGQFMNRGMA